MKPAAWPSFAPPRLLRGGHAQTLFSTLRRSPVAPPFETVELEVDADSRIRLRCSWQAQRAAPALILVHGLTGAGDSAYLVGAARNAHRRGMHSVRVDVRNCGGSEAWTPTSYQAGMTQDLRAVLSFTRRRLPDSKISLAAWSLGGNMMLKTLGELGHAARPLVDHAIAICPAIALTDAADCTDAPGIARLYRRHFLQQLRAKVRAKHRLFPRRFQVDGLEQARTMRDFDDRFTARHWHYSGVDEYYERASALPWLRHLRVPCTLLVARDDPIVPFEPFTTDAIQKNRRLHLIAEEHGGHCAFFARHRGSDPDRWWSEHRVVDLALMG